MRFMPFASFAAGSIAFFTISITCGFLPSGPDSTAHAQELVSLSGTVVDATEKPVADATVVLIYKSWPGGRYRQQSLTAQSGQDGKFAFEGLYETNEQTAFLVTILKTGFAMQGKYVLNRTGKKLEPFQFRLVEATKLTAQFVDKDGQPLQGIRVFPGARSSKDGSKHLIYQQSGTALANRTDAHGKADLSYFQEGDLVEVYISTEAGWTKVSFKVGGEPEQIVKVETPEPKRAATRRWTPEPREVDPSQVAWVRKNAIALRSIDPDDDDFSDLVPLKKLIGDARVVQLGEQSHGDGTCFETKIRLIKFLHQEMGFDVLAFESGLFDCRKAWQAFERGDPPVEAARQGVFGIWTGSRQVQPLFEYLSTETESDRPLELCGFDCQFTAAGSREHLVRELRRLVKDLEIKQPPTDELESVYKQLGELLDSGKRDVSGNQGQFMSRLDAIGVALAELELTDARQAREVQFWIQNLKSIQTQAKLKWSPRDAPNINARDQQMAENLIWLADDFYKGRKVIVWAASFHVMRNAAEIEVPGGSVNYKDTTPMGHYVTEHFGDDAFTIGFTAYDGAAGAYFRPPFRFGKAPEGTLEGICNAAELDNAILPLRGLDKDGKWLDGVQAARPLGYAWMKASWPRHFDAIVFNRTMWPSLRARIR